MSYWKEREYRNIMFQKANEQLVNDKIISLYDKTQKDIERQIRVFYERYAKDSGISITEAMRRVYKMDVEAFQDKARLLVETKDFSDEANIQLRLYNATMKINRLELLKAEIGLELLNTTDNVDSIMEKFLETRIIREYKRQSGILHTDIHYTNEDIKAIAKADYEYGNFSKILWSNHQQLHANIGIMLRRSIIQGSHPETMISRLREQFNVTKYQASRLLVTEASRVQGEVQIDAYKQAGFDKYRYIAEPRACRVCSVLDDKVFDIRDRVVGVNFYPMHPNCRCSSSVYYEDDTLEDDIRSFDREKGLQNRTKDSIIKYKEVDNDIINKYDEKASNLFGYKGNGDGILSAEEVKILKLYTGDEYPKFNKYLRGEMQDQAVFDAFNEEYYQLGDSVNNMKNTLSKILLDDNLVLYRGISEIEFNKLKENDTFENFVSTSFSKEIADEFAEDSASYNKDNKKYYLNIKAPKGTQGIYIDGKGAYNDEQEFIINVGQKYEVIEQKDNILYLEVLNELREQTGKIKK